jgi:hypothetical protein
MLRRAFFQMWQQVDDGRHDLFVWVANTINIGSQNFNFGPTPTNLDQGGLAMGFYNMHDGDVPVFRSLAERYAISDNYHQSIMGGTGANFIALVTGHAAFFNLDGVPARPFTQVLLPVVQGYAPAVQVPAPPGLPFKAFGVETEIENPNPNPAVRAATGDSNWYLADGFAGGSYVNCSDPSQAGVAPIRDHLQSLGIAPRCAPDTYYLVNNYEPGYSPAGKLLFKKNPLQALLDPADQNPFRLPPQPATVPTIADALERRGVSWGYFSGGRGDGTHPTAEYCTICDPLTHFTSIMTTPLREHLRDVTCMPSSPTRRRCRRSRSCARRKARPPTPPTPACQATRPSSPTWWRVSRRTPSSGGRRPSSSPWTRAAATTTPDRSRPWTSSATARASRSSPSRRGPGRAMSITRTPTTPRCSSSSSATGDSHP